MGTGAKILAFFDIVGFILVTYSMVNLLLGNGAAANAALGSYGTVAMILSIVQTILQLARGYFGLVAFLDMDNEEKWFRYSRVRWATWMANVVLVVVQLVLVIFMVASPYNWGIVWAVV